MNVSEKFPVSKFRVKNEDCVLPKLSYLPTKLYGITNQNTAILCLTAARTSFLTRKFMLFQRVFIFSINKVSSDIILEKNS
jgi:hypothetical protein